MYEWILLIGIAIEGEPKKPGDVGLSVIQGFTSEEKCNRAMVSLKNDLIEIGNTPRKISGMKTGQFGIGTPSVIAKCRMIEK